MTDHDRQLVDRLNELDLNYNNWPEMSDIAEQLEDAEERAFWHRRCVHLYHLEEASVGML